MTVQPPKLPGGRAVGAARQRTWAVMAAAIVLLVLNLLSGGDDRWIVSVVAVVFGGILSIGIMTGIGRADRRRFEKASGAQFGGSGTITLSELRSSPALRPLFARTKRAVLTGGMLTGTLVIRDDAVTWTPNGRGVRLNAPSFSIPRGDIIAVDAGGLPGLGNPAAFAMRLIDASTVTILTRRLPDLRSALERGGYRAGPV